MSRSHSGSASESSGKNSPFFLTKDKMHDLVNLFKLLSDETRLKILQILLHHPEYNVKSICDYVHQSQPAVSHHLALLRNSGVIEYRRDGKNNFYSLVPKRFRELRDTLQGKSGNTQIWARLFND
jgi:ArsR family transcriptional regulator